MKQERHFLRRLRCHHPPKLDYIYIYTHFRFPFYRLVLQPISSCRFASSSFIIHVLPSYSITLMRSSRAHFRYTVIKHWLHPPLQTRNFHTAHIMASAGTSSTLYAAVTAPATSAAIPEDSKDKAHHVKDGKGFRNPWDSWHDQSVLSILSAMIGRRIRGQSNSPDTTPPTVTIRKPSFLDSRRTTKLRATWLGHACYYVEFPGGLRVLFDPVFTARCSPFSFMGPKRYTEPPCSIADIPYIDACVISHAHYDHLSLESVRDIQKRYPQVQFFAPLGNKKWFSSIGIPNMTELDWWEEREIRLSPHKTSNRDEATSSSVDLVSKDTTKPRSKNDPSDITGTISCLPCQHMAARTPFDKAQTLWASWSVTSGSKSVYFGGDTGYRSVPASVPESASTSYTPEIHKKFPHNPAFKQIGEYRGPFDLGLIPIGAYSPRFVMSPMHANPFDSVNIFRDTRCKRALGIHWGTWVLTEEDVLEPPRILKEALKSKGIQEEGIFDVCDIGESREFE